MVRRLDMYKTQGIEHLFSTRMSKRKIVRTLGIDRKSIDRHLADIQSKGAISQESPIGEAPTGSSASKGAKALTGYEASDVSGNESLKPAPKSEYLGTVPRYVCVLWVRPPWLNAKRDMRPYCDRSSVLSTSLAVLRETRRTWSINFDCMTAISDSDSASIRAQLILEKQNSI
jgi:hypothetical protein